MVETIETADILDVLELLTTIMEQEELTQKAAAEQIGISPQYLNDIIRMRRDPGPKVLDWLGLEKRLVYVAKD